MKLGEVLIQKGLINPEQLRETLSLQLIYGGHLGTCLIEKGYVDERQFGQVLAEVLGVRPASVEALQDVSRGVINLLPARLVEKHCVIPFRLQNKVLDVAMIDPKNLQAIDELSFAAGHKIQSWIAPEVRIFQAMERYYGILRRQRYVALCRQLDGETSGELVLSDPIQRLGDDSAAETSPLPSRPPAVNAFGSELDAVHATDVKSADYEERLREIGAELLLAEDADGLAEAVLRHTSRTMATSILFKVKKGGALVWKSHGVPAKTATARGNPIFPIVSEPFFGLLRGENHYRGPLPVDPDYRRLHEALHLACPQEVLLLPLYVDDRLVGLFYGDGGRDERISGETHEYARLMKKLSLALHVLLLKRQIQAA